MVYFDYFFPNPTMTAGQDEGDLDLHDWTARETEFNILHVWPMRAIPFFANDKPLPRCTEGYTEFWSRFNLSGAAKPIIAADSNLYAGGTFPSTFGLVGTAWREVWLYDAHHDCYRAELDDTA